MDQKQFLSKIAQLESVNDQLISEVAYVDRLLRSVGFVEGMQSLKEVAEEMLEYEEYDLPTDRD